MVERAVEQPIESHGVCRVLGKYKLLGRLDAELTKLLSVISSGENYLAIYNE